MKLKEQTVTPQPITLNLPAPLYERLEQRARQAHRSVEDELLEVVATAVPVEARLPADLAAAIAPLPLMDDEALWREARSHLPAADATLMEALHDKRQEGLSAAEQTTLATLVRQYERYMLVRARAAALLQERGHDVSILLTSK